MKNAQEQEWNLFLVNPWNPIPENYEPELTYLRNGQAVDSRCYPELQQMMDDCRAAGLDPPDAVRPIGQWRSRKLCLRIKKHV